MDSIEHDQQWGLEFSAFRERDEPSGPPPADALLRVQIMPQKLNEIGDLGGGGGSLGYFLGAPSEIINSYHSATYRGGVWAEATHHLADRPSR